MGECLEPQRFTGIGCNIDDGCVAVRDNKSWSNLQRHENDEVGDELVDPAEVKLFPGQRLLGDEAVREAVEEAVVER